MDDWNKIDVNFECSKVQDKTLQEEVGGGRFINREIAGGGRVTNWYVAGGGQITNRVWWVNRMR